MVVDVNRTEDSGWTDLDLTANTSADAKFAILLLRFHLVAQGTGSWNLLRVRKNGTTPTYDSRIYLNNAEPVAVDRTLVTIVGLDSGQVLEYTIDVNQDPTVSSFIWLLGYIE
ncbi:hypothetical protein ES708_15438 [subsurface metagenome]